MNKSKLLTIIFFSLAIPLFLSACSTYGASSWPGMTVDTDANVVYVAYNTTVDAVNLSNGTKIWSFPERPGGQKTFFAPPVLAPDEQLIVSGYDKAIHSVNPQNGQENWSFNGAQNRFIASALVTTDAIYAPSADSRLYALDMSGNTLWNTPFRAGQALWATPNISPDGSTIYIASMDRNLYAINKSSGDVLWKTDLGGASVGTPAVSENGLLYLGTFGKELLAIDPGNGTISWRLSVNDLIWSGPVIFDNTLYFGDFSGAFYAVDQQTGGIVWQIQPSDRIVGQPFVTDDRIYLSTETGGLYAIDLRGNIVWSKQVTGTLYAGPIATETLILIAPINQNSHLVAFDLNGNQLWSYPQVAEN